MSEVWSLGVPTGEKVLRTVAVYAALALLLRVAGKRNLAQLNSFDLVVVLLLSNVVQNALIGPDNSLTGGLLAAAVLLCTSALVVRAVSRSDRAVRLFEGQDVPLVRDGRFLDRSLRREGLRRADVEAALRAPALPQAPRSRRSRRTPAPGVRLPEPEVRHQKGAETKCMSSEES
jgi:uncharacterized membrane protein YcaP (DUF421 family)